MSTVLLNLSETVFFIVKTTTKYATTIIPEIITISYIFNRDSFELATCVNTD